MLKVTRNQTLSNFILSYDKLYYESLTQSLDVQHSRHPGTFDINRVLQSKATIFRIGGEKPLLKKIVVLNDFSFGRSAYDDLNSAALELVKTFIALEFRVFIGQHTTIEITVKDKPSITDADILNFLTTKLDTILSQK